MRFSLLQNSREAVGFAIFATPAVKLFIDGLDAAAGDRVTALLEFVAERGIPTNPTKSGVIGDGLYELKCYQVRLGFIYDPSRRRTVLLMHGFIKKTDRWPKNEVKSAKRLQAETLDEIEKGNLEYGN